jgi:hypothetical protein
MATRALPFTHVSPVTTWLVQAKGLAKPTAPGTVRLPGVVCYCFVDLILFFVWLMFEINTDENLNELSIKRCIVSFNIWSIICISSNCLSQLPLVLSLRNGHRYKFSLCLCVCVVIGYSLAFYNVSCFLCKVVWTFLWCCVLRVFNASFLWSFQIKLNQC